MMTSPKMANPVVREKIVYEFAMKDVNDLLRELKDPFNVSPEAREFVDFLWNEYLTRPKKPTIPLIGGGIYRSSNLDKCDAFDYRSPMKNGVTVSAEKDVEAPYYR